MCLTLITRSNPNKMRHCESVFIINLITVFLCILALCILASICLSHREYTFVLLKNAIAIWFILTNVIAYISFYLDKRKSIAHQIRLSESYLLTIAGIGGSLGAFIAMEEYRHKTKHFVFVYGVRFFLILHIIILFSIYSFL